MKKKRKKEPIKKKKGLKIQEKYEKKKRRKGKTNRGKTRNEDEAK